MALESCAACDVPVVLRSIIMRLTRLRGTLPLISAYELLRMMMLSPSMAACQALYQNAADDSVS